MEQTNEVMDVLGRPYGLPDDVDEDDLEAGERGCGLGGGCTCGDVMYIVHACVCMYVFTKTKFPLVGCVATM